MSEQAQNLVDGMGREAALNHAYQMTTMTRDLDWLKIFLEISAA